MKALLTAALAMSLIGGAATAQAWGGRVDLYERGHDSRYDYKVADRGDRRVTDRGEYRDDRRSRTERRRWARGQHLPGAYRGHAVDYRRHQLRRPPRGYHWVQVDDDYVLSAIATGLILDVINGR